MKASEALKISKGISVNKMMAKIYKHIESLSEAGCTSIERYVSKQICDQIIVALRLEGYNVEIKNSIKGENKIVISWN